MLTYELFWDERYLVMELRVSNGMRFYGSCADECYKLAQEAGVWP